MEICQQLSGARTTLKKTMLRVMNHIANMVVEVVVDTALKYFGGDGEIVRSKFLVSFFVRWAHIGRFPLGGDSTKAQRAVEKCAVTWSSCMVTLVQDSTRNAVWASSLRRTSSSQLPLL